MALVPSVHSVFGSAVSFASFGLECEGEEGNRPRVGQVLAGVLLKLAKPVVDGVAVDIELLGSCLCGAIVVEPGLEGFEEDSSLLVGESGESGEGDLGKVVRHFGGADRGGSEQIPVEDGHATVGERAGEGDAVSVEEARELYDTFVVPASGVPLFQAAAANLNPWSEAKVDTRNPDRGPMLLLSGEMDTIAPRAISQAAFKKQLKNPSVTEFVEVPGRGHALTIDSGWREVANLALAFVQRFA